MQSGAEKEPGSARPEKNGRSGCYSDLPPGVIDDPDVFLKHIWESWVEETPVVLGVRPTDNPDRDLEMGSAIVSDVMHRLGKGWFKISVEPTFTDDNNRFNGWLLKPRDQDDNRS